MMTKYLAGVLTVIAAGVLLIAYGLLAPRTQAAYIDERAFMNGPAPVAAWGHPAAAGMGDVQSPYAQPVAFATPVAAPRQAVEYIDEAPVVKRTVVSPAPRTVTRTVATPKRTWQKTAMIIGGSSAAGAGVGALVGGKKGALIGAALGGGAGTIYETTKR